MAKLSNAPRFAQETVAIFAAGQIARARDLDGHDAIQLRVAGFVNGSESASTDLTEHLKAADLASAIAGTPFDRRSACQGKTGATDGADNVIAGVEIRQLDGIMAIRTKKMHWDASSNARLSSLAWQCCTGQGASAIAEAGSQTPIIERCFPSVKQNCCPCVASRGQTTGKKRNSLGPTLARIAVNQSVESVPNQSARAGASASS
jgi:hypothetical protein